MNCRGPVDCVRQIWRAEGLRGIFRGLGITAARDVPAFFFYFATYEALTQQEDPSVPIGTGHMMTAGGLAGMSSWLFTYPIDFLKSRLQVTFNLSINANYHNYHKLPSGNNGTLPILASSCIIAR